MCSYANTIGQLCAVVLTRLVRYVQLCSHDWSDMCSCADTTGQICAVVLTRLVRYVHLITEEASRVLIVSDV